MSNISSRLSTAISGVTEGDQGVGWDNPVIPWSELERTLSWGRHGEAEQTSARTEPAAPEQPVRSADAPASAVAWAELHCHSHFSFLDGASSPEDLVAEAVRLGVHTVGITDHDGFYGTAQFAQAARGTGLGTVFGAELSLDLRKPRTGDPDPAGRHLLVLARDAEGYRRLSRAIGAAQMAGGEKGRPVYDVAALAGSAGGHWAVLSGCRKGAVRAALNRHGPTAEGRSAAEAELRALIELFGRDHVHVELIQQNLPTDEATNLILAEAAARCGLPTIASNNVHYARPAGFPLATALAALRARRSLDEMDRWLPAAPSAHLRSGQEMLARFARHPGIVERTAELGARCAFDFDTVKPRLPDFDVPDGQTEAGYLRELTFAGAARRYGPRETNSKAYAQLDRELATIEGLGFPGYFLIVHDITEFCRTNNILCQGRGSAANSAVCYALGITNVDAVAHNLVFARFLSPEREGPPDIDIDIEAKRREEAIQHVYRRYGRDRAAQVANVITYRGKLALRDAARVLGYSVGAQDAWARRIGPHEPLPAARNDRPAHDAEPKPGPGPRQEARRELSPEPGQADEIPSQVLELAGRLERLPRHLGIHSGGMIIADRPIADVCPTEWARMEGRSVLQWDKEDCAYASLVKFDLLGLGMLGCLHDTFDLVREHHGLDLTLGTVPEDDPEVYAMLCAADAVGTFQVESRAQLATLPRLKPTCFYDLVVEVSLIRPGPIQGGAVHPYLRRRRGEEQPDPPVELLRPVLERTLGVVLFQEQCLQMAIVAADFTPGEADQLRRAMSAKRSTERMLALKDQLMAGMAANGIVGEVAEDIYRKLHAFSSYGFPESHSISMAYLVWCSSWLKRYYPAAFTTGLLANQPMGFYSPQSLIADARRHNVAVRRVDVNASSAKAALEDLTPAEREAYTTTHRFASPFPQPAIRLGLGEVRHLGTATAERIAAEREEHGPYLDMEDFVRRTDLPTAALESLATAHAFACFGRTRRQALWSVGALAGIEPGQLPGSTPGTDAPPLPAMTAIEETFADLWATAVSPDSHPVGHVRAGLDAAGITPAGRLGELRNGGLVRVAGLVTHRQRPPTAGGTCFLSLEDETGIANVICPAKLWDRQRRTALEHAALIVHGILENADGAVNILAGRLLPLHVATIGHSSRDFR
jgi:error-prone DNA polymerase